MQRTHLERRGPRRAMAFALSAFLLLAGLPAIGGGLAAPDAAHAAGLDPDGSTGPAKRSSVTSNPTGDKGGDGFVAHNGIRVRENGYTSWSSPNSALIVPDEYAYVPAPSYTDIDGNTHTATYGHLGSPLSAAGAASLTAAWAAASPGGHRTDPDGYWFYNAKTDTNLANNCGIEVAGLWCCLLVCLARFARFVRILDEVRGSWHCAQITVYLFFAAQALRKLRSSSFR